MLRDLSYRYKIPLAFTGVSILDTPLDGGLPSGTWPPASAPVGTNRIERFCSRPRSSPPLQQRIQPEPRRILMAISDGAPVDGSTLSVSPGSYLERHLRQVIKYIEHMSPV